MMGPVFVPQAHCIAPTSDVKHNVENTPGVSKCDIELVFEPAWDQSLLSDEARIELGMDPEM